MDHQAYNGLGIGRNLPEIIATKCIPDLLQSERCTMMKILAETTTLDAMVHPMRAAQPSAARPAWRSPKLDMLAAAETLAGPGGVTDAGILS